MISVDSTMNEDLVNCLSKQMCEFELLMSMYPEKGDIILSDKDIHNEIEDFVNGKSNYAPANLDFVINLVISELKVEVFVNLPLLYPIEEPDICVKCNKLNRQQETSLNSDLMDEIRHKFSGEECLYTVIVWLQENFDKYAVHQVTEKKPDEDVDGVDDDKFVRLWVYSHHIYNKKKREEITKKCKELKLTGFCLPGKPGIICVEGHDRACQDWWRDIKSMSWKKIVIRKTESIELGDITDLSKLRKFPNFEELHYNQNGRMSDFSKFMHKQGFGEMFNEFFGLGND